MSEMKYIKIQKIHSGIGRNRLQKLTLLALGLKKLRGTRLVEDSISVRGMINKVRHLVKIVG